MENYMKILNMKDMIGGWFVGNFEPTAYKTEDFEVSYKTHKCGEKVDYHYHSVVTEINFLIKGKMIMQNIELNAGDIFILHPFEVADPEFLEDTQLICVKTPSSNDKVLIKS